MKIVDGKAAGVTSPSYAAVRRLQVKLKHEQVPEHRWFLKEYEQMAREILEARGGVHY